MRDTAAVQEAARAKGLVLRILNASTESDIDTAFASLVDLQAGGLLVGDPTYFAPVASRSWRWRPVMPFGPSMTSPVYVAAGGLISYGTSLTDTYRNVGTYVGKILKGAVLVRHFNRPRMAPYLRITVGTGEDTRRLIAAAVDILGEE